MDGIPPIHDSHARSGSPALTERGAAATTAAASQGDPSLDSVFGDARAQADPLIVRADFVVCPGGMCVPTDGALRIEDIRGVPYVIGHCTWERCDTWDRAARRLAARIAALDPHSLAIDALSESDLQDPNDFLGQDAQRDGRYDLS